ncbi:uncharacterized protein B0I36DRAFT_396342 [Microdochium trichocladiopsis]|uniref:Uncharacterized protein n=1 Tax=Microdochium trichocladiopsis TaxID=1682393 RepID=A0A9P9BMA7_9PEZI|nr:uncharacterized protein B0I36DRAFT_396342 [Microdochium trichocladiopsis]KAH7016240.1 hypothetical protein B0I36DRAFT_396342 [Microdochium trichocladiopsis]
MLVGRVCQHGIKAIPIAQAAPKSSRVHHKSGETAPLPVPRFSHPGVSDCYEGLNDRELNDVLSPLDHSGQRVNKYVTWIKDFKATECTQPLDPGGSAPESLARGVAQAADLARRVCKDPNRGQSQHGVQPKLIILKILNNLVPTESATSNTIKNLQPNFRNLSYASRVSRQLRRVAEPLLYRYIYPTRQLLETLCERPELGNHVHEVGESSPPLTLEEREAVKPLHNRVHELAKDIYDWPVLDAFLEYSSPPKLDENHITTDSRDDNTTWLPSILCLTPHVQTLHLNVYQLECKKLDTLAQLFQLCEDRIDYEKEVLSTKLRTLKTSGIDWGLTGMGPRPDAEEAKRRDDSIFPGGPPRRELYTSQGSHPNLENLSLCDNRSPDPSLVKEMLEAYPNLHTLVLKPSQRMARQSFDFSKYGIVLRKRATGLRCLDLGFPGISHFESDGGAIGSLRHECTQLKQLRLPLAALFGLDPPGKLDLCDYLPISLRWFWTTLPEEENYAQVCSNALASMLDDKRLPQLEWVLVILPEGCELKPTGFSALRHGERHVLYWRKPTCVIRTPPGWEDANVEKGVALP